IAGGGRARFGGGEAVVGRHGDAAHQERGHCNGDQVPVHRFPLLTSAARARMYLCAFHHSQPEWICHRAAICDARGQMHGAARGRASVGTPVPVFPAMATPLLLPVLAWARRLRYPTLFKVTAALFVLSVLLPDPIPMIDEILLGLGTLVLANWKNRNARVIEGEVVDDYNSPREQRNRH